MLWRCRDKVFDCSLTATPLLMGIVNVTPDSFSDGGRYLSVSQAVEHGLSLLEAGADILDVGGESTRPGAAVVSAEEEMERILPVVEQLSASAVVSVDTMKAEVMRAALAAGAAIINDVNGFRGDGALAAVADSDCGLVVMHMQGEPRTMQESPDYADVVGEVGDFFHARLADFDAAAVARERLCLDPGIGFGKTAHHNIALLRDLSVADFDRPLLFGVSRKSLFKSAGDAATPPAARDTVSAVAAALLAERGVGVLRVHEVAVTRAALSVARWFIDEAPRRVEEPING